MSDNSKVSIIIPIYNAMSIISNCVDSILNQTYSNIEVLLVDDGSTDDSKKICRDYEKKDKRVKYLYKNNGGVSSARNYGIKHANGEFVFFIDADDYLDINAIESLLNAYKNGCIIGLKHTNVYSTKKQKVDYKDCYYKEDFINNILDGSLKGVIWGFLISYDDIKNVCFDENTYFLEDMLFLITLLLKANIKKILFVESQYYYVISDNSITGNSEKTKEKCEKILYSLDRINEVTEGLYYEKIENKKIILLEKQLRFLVNTKDIKDCLNNIRIPKYYGNKKFYKFYSYLINKHKFNQISFYYKIRQLLKKIKKGS